MATVVGPLDLKDYLSVREGVRSRLETTHAPSVLLDIRSAVLRVSVMEVFDAAASTADVIPHGVRYAIVFSAQTLPIHDARFGENVARNRGAQLKAFTDISRAREWLAEGACKAEACGH